MSRRSRKRNSWKRMGSWEGRLRSRISKTEARLTMQVAKSGLANGIKDANRMVKAATKKIVRRGKYGGRLDAKTVMAQIRKDLHVGGRKRMRRNPFERNLSHHAHVSRATGMIPMPYDRLEPGDASCAKGYTRLGFSRVCAPKKSSRQARAELYNEDWAEQAMTPNRGPGRAPWLSDAEYRRRGREYRQYRRASKAGILRPKKSLEWRDYGLGRTDSLGGKKVVRTPLGRPCPKGYKRLPGMRACVEARGGKKGRKRGRRRW